MQIMSKPYIKMWQLLQLMVMTCGKHIGTRMAHDGDTWLDELTIELTRWAHNSWVTQKECFTPNSFT